MTAGYINVAYRPIREQMFKNNNENKVLRDAVSEERAQKSEFPARHDCTSRAEGSTTYRASSLVETTIRAPLSKKRRPIRIRRLNADGRTQLPHATSPEREDPFFFFRGINEIDTHLLNAAEPPLGVGISICLR